jgi:hypothetical protein
MPSSITVEGPLSKWTNMIQGWQFRWFVLDTQSGLLQYYTSRENIVKGDVRGCIRLKEAYVGYDNEDDITFTITVDDKTFHLQARNLYEREKWVNKIEKAIRLHSNTYKMSSSLSRNVNQANNAANSKSSIRANNNNPLSFAYMSTFANNRLIDEGDNGGESDYEGSKSLKSQETSSLSNQATTTLSGVASVSSPILTTATPVTTTTINTPSTSTSTLINSNQHENIKRINSNLTESDAYLQLLIEQLKVLIDLCSFHFLYCVV